MGMWGVEEYDTKGKARLPSTVYYIYIQICQMENLL